MKTVPIAAIFALLGSTIAYAAPATNVATDQKAYIEWSGDSVQWPQNGRPVLTLSSRQQLMESTPITRFYITGSLGISILDMGPFIQGSPAPGFSLVLRDSRLAQGRVTFAVFKNGEFIDGSDKDSLMAYAKGLVIKAPKDQTVTIVEEPARLEGRILLLRTQPMMITWQRTTAASQKSELRTDYFFPREDQTLVISAISDPETQPAVREALEQLLRFSEFSE